MAEAALTSPAPRAAPQGLWVLPPLLALALIFFYPLSLILRQSFGETGVTLDHFRQVLASRQFQNGLYYTIIIAVTATAGCVVLGFLLSLVIAFVPFPGSKFFARLIDTIIAFPTFLVTLAFTFIYGSAGILNISLMRNFGFELPPVDFLYSRWGVILAEITVFTPFIMRPLLAAFSQIDPAQIEVAASLGAKPLRIIRQIILPAALPALLAGGSLCLLLTINEFGIVLFIGAKDVITLPMMIYMKAVQEFDYTAACVIAAINIVLSLGLYGLYRSIVGYVGGGRAGMV